MVKHYYQEHISACGPACLRMALESKGIIESEEVLMKKCEIKRGKGTSHSKLLKVVRGYGFDPRSSENNTIEDLEEKVRDNGWAIVNYINPNSGKGHYSIVVDVGDGKIVMQDPTNGPGYMIDVSDFIGRWHNFARDSFAWIMVF
jgi:ABC-type bacteriocin/lantibiotic exporter with double-glycine peptidase domain